MIDGPMLLIHDEKHKITRLDKLSTKLKDAFFSEKL
jgi:hypothetical protein